MHSVQRYTAFPTLHKTPGHQDLRQGSHEHYTHSFPTPSGTACINLHHAWAELLWRYTGENTVRFETDDSDLIGTRQHSWSFEDVPKTNHKASEIEPKTSLFFAKNAGDKRPFSGTRPSGRWLELRIDGATATLLSSCDTLPYAHLRQVAYQFQVILHDHLGQKRPELEDGSIQNSHEELSILNPDPQRLPGPKLLHEVIGQHVQGADIALEHNDFDGSVLSISYDHLDAYSSCLAQKIRRKLDMAHKSLSNPITVVPVLLPQSPELYIAIIAVLKAGAAFCPIGLDVPAERIAFIFQDVHAEIVLTTPSLRSNLPEIAGVKLLEVSLEALSKDGDVRVDMPLPRDSDACYVMYTSGSTGEPKGVVLPHSAVVQSLLAHERHVPQFKRFLQTAATTFDVSIFEIFFPLMRGSTVVSCERHRLYSDLPKALLDLQIDAAEFTPTVVTELLHSRARCPTLKVLLTIGEMLTDTVVKGFGCRDESTRSAMDCTLLAMYGPTEAAIHCTLEPCLDVFSRLGNIGRPLSSASAFIASLDVTSSPFEILPTGQLGELVIGGHQLALQYLNRPKETEKSFIDDAKFGRLYRTGDLCRLLPNGSLEIVGRKDASQTKIRGQRVELDEIEQTIIRKCGVDNAAAAIFNDRLVAFPLRNPHMERTPEEIITICRSWLPAFMVPSSVVMLDSLPRNSSGKLDRKKLLDVYTNNVESIAVAHCNRASLAPTSPDEILFCETFSQLFGKNVSLDSSATAAGIDSLKAIRLASALRQLGFKSSALDIMTASSIQSFIQTFRRRPVAPLDSSNKRYQDLKAEAVRSVQLLDGMSEILPQTVFPATPLQSSMLAESMLDETAYWNRIELRLPSILGPDHIERSFHALAAKHEILRSGFYATEKAQCPFAIIIRPALLPGQISRTQMSSEQFVVRDMRKPFQVALTREKDHIRAVVMLHHAIYDGWSWDILRLDLKLLLSGAKEIQGSKFSDAIPALTKSPSERSIAFWRNYLESFRPSLLPSLITKRKTDMPNTSSLKQEIQLDWSSSECHPQTLFQLAFALILRLYSRIDDVVIGTVHSGRTAFIDGIETMVGPFMATVPLRIKVDNKESVEQQLKKVQNINTSIASHLDLGLKDIKSNAGLDPGELLFDALIVWQESIPIQSFNTDEDLVCEIRQKDFVEHKLLLEIEPREQGVLAKLTYKLDAIDESLAHHILRQLVTIVDRLSGGSTDMVENVTSNLPESLLSVSNFPPKGPMSPMRSLTEALTERARSDPEEIAVAFVENSTFTHFSNLTYSELDRCSDVFAQVYLDHGIQPNDVICLFMDKCAILYAAAVAIAKIGATYLPMPPETPEDRMKHIFTSASVKTCVVSETANSERVGLLGLSFINITNVEWRKVPRTKFSPQLRDDYIAYIINTSGTTGLPKGVPVTQKNLASNITVIDDLLPQNRAKGSRILQSSSIAFDVSVFEIFYAFHTGMCLCSGPKDIIYRDIEYAIRRFGVTYISVTPTVAGLVKPDNVPSLKTVVTLGEALTETVFRDWADRGLWQGYGPSETTNILTVEPNVTRNHAIRAIGPPFLNSSAFVAEIGTGEDLRLLPFGALGELCFGGDQVFPGYLEKSQNQGKLFHHVKYGSIYRSGDMGRLMPTGEILIAGRMDDQIKLRGLRIELGEITQQIVLHTEVSDATTILTNSTSQQQMLISFWVPVRQLESDDSFLLETDEEIKAIARTIIFNLEKTLQPYMMPSALVPLTRLPRTGQSKIDRRKLYQLSAELAPNYYISAYCDSIKDASEQHTWSLTERSIQEAFCEVMKVDSSQVDRTAPFFAYGLDSLSAIPFARALQNRQPPIEVEVSSIMRFPTIQRLATVIEPYWRAGTVQTMMNNSFAPFDQSVVDSIRSMYSSSAKLLPTTPLQEAMLRLHSSQNGTTSYLNKTTFKINGDVEKLKQAWTQAIARHDILRTTFIPIQDRNRAFAQVVMPKVDLPWSVIQPTDLGILENKDTNRVFARDQPLWIIHQLDSTKDGCLLILSMHHALYDGAALHLLLEDIERLYHGISTDIIQTFPKFLELVEQRNNREAEDYWRKQLSGFEPTRFPNLTGVSPKTLEHRVGSKAPRFSIDIALDELEAFCRSSAVSLLCLCQLAFLKLLSFYQDDRDVCFGNVVSGRTMPVDGIQQLVAPCFNTIPVRMTLRAEDSNADLLQRLQSYNGDCLPFQLTPLRKIQQLANSNGNRLFEALFILQQPTESLDESIWSILEDSGDMDLPFVCEVTPDRKSNTLIVQLHCHDNIINPEDIDCVFGTFKACLSSCINDPNGPVMKADFSDQSITSSSEARQAPISPSLLHGAFLDICDTSPQKLALDFLENDGSRTKWTFSTLLSMSRGIAISLLKSGMRQGDTVPVHVPKSPSFYASILGVLLAGGSFTPLDPMYPMERKGLIVQEINAKMVITSSQADNSWIQPLSIVVEHVSQSFESLDGQQNNDSSRIAYTIYTSGSTGRPKGVDVEHKNATETIKSSRNKLPWSPATRLLNFASLTFDMCYYDIFLAWSFGFCLCAASQGALIDDLAKVSRSLEVTMLDLTPSMAITVRREEVPTVEFLYCIGEQMTQKLVEAWEGSCVNSYGPTESAMCITIFNVDPKVKSTVIGKPFPSSRFHVLQPGSLQAVPCMGIGELCIEGPQLARGYRANEEATTANFIIAGGTRLYRTGDLVRKLGTGNYEHVGRLGSQVKIRGQRVELEEINAVIKDGNIDIAEVCSVISVDSHTSAERLTAFMVLHPRSREAHEAIAASLRQHLQSKLPYYMIPNAFKFLKSFPRNGSSKIDTKALQANAAQDSHPSNDLDTFRSASVEIVTDLQNAIKLLSPVGLEAFPSGMTIYGLGFDSISTIQLASSLRSMGYACGVRDVLSRPILSDLSEFLEQQKAVTDRKAQASAPDNFNFHAFDNEYRPLIASRLSILPSTILACRPCTPLQSGMLAETLRSHETIYINRIEYSLPGDVDTERLREAWDTVMERNEILRSGFVAMQDSKNPFVMITYRARSVGLPFVTTGSADEYEREIKLAAWGVLDALQKQPWSVILSPGPDHKRMLFTAHHSLYDAHSLALILDEVQSVYFEEVLPRPVNITEILGQVMHSSVSSESLDRADAFWKQSLKSGYPSKFPNVLNYHLPETEPKGFKTVRRETALTFSVVEHALKSNNLTLQSVAQVAWGSTLANYIREDVVTFGMIYSGRTFDDSQKAIMPLITTIPVQVDISDDRHTVLSKMTSFNAEVIEHLFTPFRRISQALQMSGVRLFDTILSVQRDMALINGGPLFREVVSEYASAESPVSIEIELSNRKGLHLQVVYHSNKMSEPQADVLLQLLEYQLRVMMQLGPSPGQAPVSYRAPRALRLEGEATLLHEFVELSSYNMPHDIAFEFAGDLHGADGPREKWTYAELDAISNQVANLIISRGVKQNSIIAICFDKCPQASFSLIGVLKAGCSFLAIDPKAPSVRKQFIFEDSGSKMLITTEDLIGSFGGEVDALILDGSYPQVLDGCATDNPAGRLERRILPSDRSYCLYTSGTTGTPKGCELTHENAVQALLAFRTIFRWNEKSRWLQFASFHFDVSVLEQFWSWSVGICCVSAPRDLILEDLPGTIRQLQITHLDLTPSLARIVDPKDVPTLCTEHSVFITGGEALRQEIIDSWGPHQTVYNGYGPTEATIGVTMFPRVTITSKPENIGFQFPNVGAYVLKPETFEPVLLGCPGELCVFGPLVAKGYLRRSELTAERFPTMPSGERIYRTGDIVRLNPDHTFTFLGRIDDQVKLRGQRLEIGEIDSIVESSCHDIDSVSTVITKHPKHQREQLVTFIVPKISQAGRRPIEITIVPDKSGIVEMVKQACAVKLPSYMIPTHFILLSRMPLSANNKKDSKKLQEFYSGIDFDDWKDRQSPKHAVAEANESDNLSSTEQKIILALAEFTTVDSSSISRDTSIFELGIDSISVIMLTSKLRDAGLPLLFASTLLQKSTVSGIASYVDKTSNINGMDDHLRYAQHSLSVFDRSHRQLVAESLKLPLCEIQQVMPCTALQQGMLSRSMECSEPIYHHQFRFELLPETHGARLFESWSTLTATEEILRTVFIDYEDGYLQAVLKANQPSSSRLLELHVNAAEEIDDKITQEFEMWRKQGDCLARQPWQLVLAVSQSRRILSFHVYHALYDGASLSLLLSEFVMTYRKGSSNTSTRPSFRVALPYGPLLHHADSTKFWQNHLSGFGPSDQCSSHTMAQRHGSIQLSRRMKDRPERSELLRNMGITSRSFYQAAWSVLIQSVFQTQCVVGQVVSGRHLNLEGAQEVIGPMFNTIPFLLRLQAQSTWHSVIQRCHAFNIESLRHHHTPLRDIQRSLGISGALFETLFVFEAEIQLQSPVTAIWKPLDSKSYVDHLLALEIGQSQSGQTTMKLAARDDSFTLSDLESLAQKLEDMVDVMLRKPQSSVADTLDISYIHQDSLVGNAKVKGTVPASYNSYESQAMGAPFEWTENAEHIRRLISHICGVQEGSIGPYVSILEMGLDSIDAVKLSSRLKRKAGLELHVSAIMRHPTISGMLPHVKVNRKDHTSDKELQTFMDTCESLTDDLRNHIATMKNVEQVLPATPLQESIMAQTIDSEFQLYFNHDVLLLSEEIELDRLKRAWKEVYNNSPILRTAFHQIQNPGLNGSFAQVVHRPSELPWLEIETDDSTFLTRIKDQLRSTLVNSAEPLPMFYLTHVKRKKSQQDVVVLSICHALYDGHSITLLHRDVSLAYRASYSPRPSYISTVMKFYNAAKNEHSRGFFRDYLDTLSYPKLSPNSKQDHSSESYCMEATSRIAVADIESFCSKSSVTVNSLVQTAWTLSLAILTRRLEVTYGNVFSCREGEEDDHLLFPTMNTVPTRHFIDGSKLELIRSVQKNLALIMEHQRFPLSQLQTMVRSASPLFESLFVFQGNTTESSEGPWLYKSIDDSATTEYPLAIEARVSQDVLVWQLAANSKVMEKQQAKQFIKSMDVIMHGIITQPTRPCLIFRGKDVQICDTEPFRPCETDNRADTRDELESPTFTQADSDLDETELLVRNIFAEVSMTDVKNIGRDSTLQHIGLDSISAIRIVSLFKKHGIKIRVSQMMLARSVRRIAALIAEAPTSRISPHHAGGNIAEESFFTAFEKSALRKVAHAGISPASIVTILPATSGQTYMIEMQRRYGTFYHSFTYQINEAICRQPIESAWSQLISKHSILRTIFILSRDQESDYLQIVLDRLPPFKSEASVVQPASPLIKLSIENGGPSRYLELKIHHALYDGFSLPTLIQDLEALMSGREDSAIRNASEAYQTFACERLRPASVLDRQRFWHDYWNGANPSLLTGSASTSSLIPSGNRVEIFEPTALRDFKAVQNFCQQQSISIQALIMSAYARIYATRCDHSSNPPMEVAIGLYLANRSHDIQGLDEAPMPTVNLIALRIQLHAGREGVLKSAREVQDDLAAINESVSRGSLSLTELASWTSNKVKVNTWVNFLPFQRSEDADTERALERITSDSTAPYSRVEPRRSIEMMDFGPENNDEQAKVEEVFLPAIDFEVRQHDDHLAMGLFAPEELLTCVEGEQMLESLASLVLDTCEL